MFPFKNKIQDVVNQVITTKEDKIALNNKLVEEIHNEFNIAGDMLIKQAKTILEENAKKDLEKGKRMAALGFTGTNEAKQAKGIEEANIKQQNLFETVDYFQNTYPKYKFITEDVVKRICAKYNLLMATCDKYLGDIPDKNLKEIEDFNQFLIREEDMQYTEEYVFGWNGSKPKQISCQEYKEKTEDKFKDRSGYGLWAIGNNYYYSINKQFMICAPKSQMDTENMRIVDGYKLQEIPDPVVLFPVRGGMLIISAWGKESNDIELQHGINN